VRKAGEEFSDFILIDENDKFLIDRLLDERIIKGKIEYLIKWVGYSDYNNIWESL
jgi:chromobox protein 1